MPRSKLVEQPILEKYVFIPNETALSTEESIRINMQIVYENSYSVNIKVAEIIERGSDSINPLASLIYQALNDMPLVQPDVTLLSPFRHSIEGVEVENKTLNSIRNVSIVVAENLLTRPDVYVANNSG